MDKRIIYRHWQSGDDDAVLAFLPNTSEDWYRHKFDEPNIEPEGILLAFVDGKVVGHAMGESTSLYIEERVQIFGIVSAVFVAPDMRRQGIATRLMDELHAYFLKKGYRGSILTPKTEGAYQLYKKIGYQETGKELQTELSPRSNTSHLKWTEVNLEDLGVLYQINGIYLVLLVVSAVRKPHLPRRIALIWYYINLKRSGQATIFLSIGILRTQKCSWTTGRNIVSYVMRQISSVIQNGMNPRNTVQKYLFVILSFRILIQWK